jgi:prolyl-tRNA synthetase
MLGFRYSLVNRRLCLLAAPPTCPFQEVIEGGMWARAPWAGSIEDEAAVLEETGASLRCVPLAQPVSMWSGYSTCVYSGYQASEVAIFARAL